MRVEGRLKAFKPCNPLPEEMATSGSNGALFMMKNKFLPTSDTVNLSTPLAIFVKVYPIDISRMRILVAS